MPKLALLNQAGDNIGDIEIQDSIFGIEPNQQALYEVVKAQRAAMRQGTHSTKSRGLVRGGGRKPWRQKGTGRARQGTIRAPQWVGGGVVFGPTPRSYIVKVNKKVRRLALKSALSSKVAEKQFFILDALNVDSPKTKEVVQVLNNLSLSGKVMIVLDKPNETVLLAARNIPGVTVRTAEQASVYELMNSHTLLATQDAVKKYEEVLG
ncbi:MAG: 50S ribosomal protein L4 [Bacillota bacterium]